MTKNRSKMLIIFLTLILIVGLVASFVSFTYPLSIGGVKYRYSSFVNELVLGSDINEGVLFEYKANVRNVADEDNYDKLMDNTLDGLRDILNSSGFKNSTISRKGEDEIRVEVGGIINADDSAEVRSLIGNPKQLVFSSSTSPDDAFMTSDYIKEVKASEASNGIETVHYVEIVFTDKGYDLIVRESKKIVDEGGEFYMLLGDTQIANSKDAVTTNSLTITSPNFVDKATTEQYAVQIRTGMLPLELVCSYNGIISASAGVRGNVTNPMLYIWVAFAVMVIASIVFFILRYKQIGLMAMFNMLFYIVLGLFFLQSVPLVHINLSGIFAMMLAYVLAIVAITNTLENARREYAKGKKLHTSMKQGINASLTSTLTINIMLVLAGIVCALMPTMSVQSFGIVTMILGFVNIFCAQALMRLMLKLYLVLNPEDGKKCNFIKEEGLNND
jgi:preprotein translocase subunit SecD